jgi:hypothetical protein
MNNNLLRDDFEGNIRSIAITQTHIGIAYYNQHNYTAAVEHLIKAAANFETFGDLRGLSWSESYLAIAFLKKGESVDAAPYIQF